MRYPNVPTLDPDTLYSTRHGRSLVSKAIGKSRGDNGRNSATPRIDFEIGPFFLAFQVNSYALTG